MLRPSLIAIGMVLASTSVLCGAGPSQATPSDPALQSASPPETSRVRSLLAKAYSMSDSAVVWMEENLTQERAGALYGELKGRARGQYERAIDTARQRYARTLGLRMLDDHQVTSTPTWTRCEELGPEVSLPTRLVLLVHGLDEPGDIWNELAPAVRTSGLEVARFDYPNDGPISRSAEALADAMSTLARKGVSSVDLVCHSMGGLVARDMLTRGAYYDADGSPCPGMPRVERLIMVGTPNQGSPWAHVEFLAEARDQLQRWLESDSTDIGTLVGFLVDGRGEAADDLLPGSAFLSELNSRALPRGIRVTSVAGRLIPLNEEDVQSLLDCRLVRALLTSEEIHQLSVEAERIAAAVGDGPVSVDSVKLEGVADFVVCTGEHCYLLRQFPFSRTEPPAIPIVIDRLLR